MTPWEVASRAIVGCALQYIWGRSPCLRLQTIYVSRVGKLVPYLSWRIRALTRYIYRPPRVTVWVGYAFINRQQCLMESNVWRIPQGWINGDSFILFLYNKIIFSLVSRRKPSSQQHTVVPSCILMWPAVTFVLKILNLRCINILLMFHFLFTFYISLLNGSNIRTFIYTARHPFL